MKTEPIPAQWVPFASYSVPYWWGMDTLESHWERTKSFAAHEPDSDTFQEFMFWRRISVVWACSTIEAFVNEEGVAWLGEGFYRDNLERLGILQKIHTLYVLKYRVRLPRKLEGLTHVTKLFELRNSLVHPKAREVSKESTHEKGHPCELRAMEFKHLRRVFWTVTALFEPCGVGESEGETTNKHMHSGGDTLSDNQSES